MQFAGYLWVWAGCGAHVKQGLPENRRTDFQVASIPIQPKTKGYLKTENGFQVAFSFFGWQIGKNPGKAAGIVN